MYCLHDLADDSFAVVDSSVQIVLQRCEAYLFQFLAWQPDSNLEASLPGAGHEAFGVGGDF
ncbi:hypothetical protein BB31_15680 [Amycolatopsis lurida NRRL 2430]|uniref:Uncharacterized protein n=1 Tax=Amycolatopsis lurida NRRL 2430 TaxID=1460371 RepID=A0A2P2FUA0_AMYLU|nr:hypothetical protein BB31_15680 [Amycolatopsis lurida NRRL 2430]